MSDCSSDAFDASPIPAKKRRLVPRFDSDDLSEEESLARSHKVGSKKVKSEAVPQRHGSKRQLKIKDRAHESVEKQKLEDTYATQLPTIDSSPYRIRGAIWQKSAKITTPEAQSSDLAFENHELGGENHQRISNEEPSNSIGDALSENDRDLDFDISDIASVTDCENGLTLATNESSTPTKPTQVKEKDIEDEFDVDADIAQELADLPSDAFDSDLLSSPNAVVHVAEDHLHITTSSGRPPAHMTRPTAPLNGLRQTTLFGGAVACQQAPELEDGKRYNWPSARKDEKPTHHKLNQESLRTWIYPINLGTVRDYQYNIVARGLYHNLLVALPTGLGKTFIAATIMLNWLRWTTEAQIVFVAPTRPLVAQQVEACLGIAGIPRSSASMLTGGIPPGLRAEEWATKRVFFLTPQTILNDLKSGICNPKRIVLLVVDEAHRATGSYAYVEVVKFMLRYNQSFRILALTATPGSSVESVQEVIDGLSIARVEIRTEFSLDIRQYVHSRNTETILFDNSEEMEMIMDSFSKALRPVVSKLNRFNAYWSKDPMQLTAYGLTQARQKWMSSAAGRSADFAIKGMLNRIFTVLASLAHSIELLKFHGIGPFYNGMLIFRSNNDSSRGGKYEKEILESEHFRKMMTRLQFWMNNPTFVGHPKLEYLQEVVLNHFLDAGEGRGIAVEEPPSNTRVMIFAHYRDSAEDIVRVLKRHEPMVRAHVFVGQAASKGSEGMDQKRQLEIIQKFKSGVYNTIVATSIGEEGLDIGEIDRIICYDSSASPIRMLQRMGRTGRKRAGNITLLLMKGKEERSFLQAKDNYEKMQLMIADGKRFNFHDETNAKILPADTQPVVDKRMIEIPQENKEAPLPEPKKRGRIPKKPPKKFHMPDGVQTGFVKVSSLGGSEDCNDDDHVEVGIGQDSNNVSSRGKRKRKVTTPKARSKARVDTLETIPALENVLLTDAEKLQLRRRYQDVGDRQGHDTVIEEPRVDAFPAYQRTLRPSGLLAHAPVTKQVVEILKSMRSPKQSYLVELQRKAKVFANIDFDEACRVVPFTSLPSPTSDKNVSERGQKDARKVKIGQQQQQASWGKTSKQSYSAIHTVSVEVGGSSSSPPLSSPRLHLASQGISLGSDDTEGENEPDGLPTSTLADFIVTDDEEHEPSTPSGTDPSSSIIMIDKSTATRNRKKKKKKNDLFGSSELAGSSQHSDVSSPAPGEGGDIIHSSFPEFPSPPRGTSNLGKQTTTNSSNSLSDDDNNSSSSSNNDNERLSVNIRAGSRTKIQGDGDGDDGANGNDINRKKKKKKKIVIDDSDE